MWQMRSCPWSPHPSSWRLVLCAGTLVIGVLAMHTLTISGAASAGHSMPAVSAATAAGDGHTVLAAASTQGSDRPGPDNMAMTFMMCLGVIVGFGLLLCALRDPTRRRRSLLPCTGRSRLISAVTAARPPPSLAQFSVLRC